MKAFLSKLPVALFALLLSATSHASTITYSFTADTELRFAAEPYPIRLSGTITVDLSALISAG